MNLVGTLETHVEVTEIERIVNVFHVKMRFSEIGMKAYKQKKGVKK